MSITSATIMLFLVMNPLGNLPIFLSILKPFGPKRHTKIIIRESFFAYLLLISFMFFGEIFLHSVHISQHALGISGGIIMFIISLHLIFPPEKQKLAHKEEGEPFFVPLTMPLTAGPGAITTVMLFSTQQPERKLAWFIAITVTSVAVSITLLAGRYLGKFLGEKGLTALEKLSGMMLVAYAVQMFLVGVNAYFRLNY